MLDKIECLAAVYAETEPSRFNDFKDFWNRWLSDEIPGDKHTIIKEVDDKVVGVLRLWKSPYKDNGYLVEGLEVLESYRRNGYAKDLLLDAVAYMKSIGEEYLYSNIMDSNEASIRAHQSIGFKLIESNTKDSYGQIKEGLGLYRINTINSGG